MSSPSSKDADYRRQQRQQRQEWYGSGSDEKHWFWQFCDDLFYGVIDVSIPSLLGLFYLMSRPSDVLAGIATPVFFALGAMIVTVALFYGGWLSPLGESDWVPLTPSLFLLRIPYYSSVLGIAAYGGATIELVTNSHNASTLFAIAVAIIATGTFPRFTKVLRRSFSER
jgi:hypothetical protein